VWTQLERNYGEELLKGGLDVVTTLDVSWQSVAEEAASRHLEKLNNPPSDEPDHNAHNAALVALDPIRARFWRCWAALTILMSRLTAR